MSAILIRTISLWQPWASAIALGVKTIETRDWVSRYKGPLAIHAAQRKSTQNRRIFEELRGNKRIEAAFGQMHYAQLPFGQVICVVRMRDCVTITRQNSEALVEHERLLGNFKAGRQGWILDNARQLVKPHPVTGRQGFFWVRIPEACWPGTGSGGCYMCGCTEKTACVSNGEPCHWVEENLCSACAAIRKKEKAAIPAEMTT